jgi:hypothetical protein
MPYYSKTTNEERFRSKFVPVDGCWQWDGTAGAKGYGYFDWRFDTRRWKKLLAHRVSYELFVGPLEHEDTVDHLCRNTRCVNPKHLEAVPTGVNSRRSPHTLVGANVRKTHCPKGHPYSGENLFYDQGKRKCRECVRLKNRLADARRRAERRVAAGQ